LQELLRSLAVSAGVNLADVQPLCVPFGKNLPPTDGFGDDRQVCSSCERSWAVEPSM
jgi:hypothetical protein